jgi:RNA polymerase sigma factor (sigma-70 family)
MERDPMQNVPPIPFTWMPEAVLSYAEGSIERRLLENDPEALGQVFRWIASTLTSPQFWSLRSEWRDLHQEVVTRVVESLRHGRFDASREFHSYVQGVARYTALQALTARPQRSSNDLDGLVSEKSPSAEERTENRQLVRRVLERASEECRELIRAYFLEERSYAEIADGLALPVGTVKSRLFRCLESARLSIQGRSLRRLGKASNEKAG